MHRTASLVGMLALVLSVGTEDLYQERATASSLAGRAARPESPRPTASAETPHLAVATSASDPSVAPGTRFSLFVDIFPKPTIHVYAPGEKDAIPVALTLTPDESFKVHPPRFPKAEKYFFAPLELTQLVYSKPFRIAQDVTAALTPALRERARATGAALAIKGTLRYQACDDKVCYLPKELELSWTVSLRSLER